MSEITAQCTLNCLSWDRDGKYLSSIKIHGVYARIYAVLGLLISIQHNGYKCDMGFNIASET